MKRSLNEIQGMALKAARGAGLPLGLAEDYSQAAGRLMATQPDAQAEIANALNETRISDQTSLIWCMSCALEQVLIGEDAVQVNPADTPVLLQCYVDNACLNWDVALSACSAGKITQGNALPKALPPACSIDVSETLWNTLSELAHRTYVPASEASRVAGAGAGLTDND